MEAEFTDTEPLVAAPPPVARQERQYKGAFSFIRRHWNGDYSLGRSYWVHTFLLSLLAPLLARLTVPLLADHFPARYASAAFLIIFVLGIVIWVWAIGGTLASSNKHVSRGGRSGWALAARLAITLSILKTGSDIVVGLPALKDHAVVAAGTQFGADNTFQLRADGHSLLLLGGINDGTSAALSRELDKAPGVTTVVLSSAGGWLREGKMVADVIRARGLATYVEDYCASACTIAFLAGRQRAASPMARIGFHTSKGVGSGHPNPSTKDPTHALVRAIYQEAGIGRGFIDKVMNTPHAEMWHPTVDEMLAAGVLTRRSGGGETAALATSMKSKEDLSANFKKLDLYAQLAEKAPREYAQIVDAAWAKISSGATDAEAMDAARQHLMAVLPRFLPMATDATLIEYHALQTQQVKALKVADVHACSEMAFPNGNHRLLIAHLPRELALKENDMLARVLREAEPARARKPTQKEKTELGRQVFKDMSETQQRVFYDEPFRQAAGPAVVCDAVLAFYAGLNAIPTARRGQSLRFLYASI